ncbi:MAG: hypothetical protein ACN4GW_08240 [Desulforhopalus sp.]
MKIFFFYMVISFLLLLVVVKLISYCKRRQSRTSHGLTGMCHETGGTMCSSCSSHLQPDPLKVQAVTCKKTSD